MIEMRWYTSADGQRVLQYRQMVDVTVRSGIWSAEEQLRTSNFQWSEWRTVPDVAERDVSCP